VTVAKQSIPFDAEPNSIGGKNQNNSEYGIYMLPRIIYVILVTFYLIQLAGKKKDITFYGYFLIYLFLFWKESLYI
jgi:hypothetical protein